MVRSGFMTRTELNGESGGSFDKQSCGDDQTGGGSAGREEAIMADIGARESLRDITSYQWLVLFVAWAGWSLDITDFTLYGLVLRQALTELIGGTPTMAQIGKVGGLLTTIGLSAGH